MSVSKNYILKQGDLFRKSVQFTLAAFDFTGCTVRCHLRDSSGNKMAELAVTVLSNTTGDLVVQLEAIGTVTAKWPITKLLGDIEISRVSPAFGPYTPVDITVDVKKDFTNG